MKKEEKQRGITLVALVITVIIIIILATVTINMAFGDNGLIKRAEKGKEDTQIAYTREELQSVLADAFVEKKINKEYNENEFLDEFVYSIKPEAELTEDEISLNGYTFELNRNVPELGDYIGEAGNLPAKIRKIEIIEQTAEGATETVTVKVTTARAEGANYKYSYKLAESSDYTGEVEKTENTHTIEGLKRGNQYTIKVELIINEEVVDEKTISLTTSVRQVTATEIAQEASTYYGKEVLGYTCPNNDAVNKWRIFHVDESNIYLIADDYISYQDAPKGKMETAITSSYPYRLSLKNIESNYTGESAWIKENSKGAKWLNQYLNTNTSTNINMKAVSYMMDTNVWNVYKGEDAEYAMGGPTLEMFCASYQKTHPVAYIECTVSSITGYMVRTGGDSFTNWTKGLEGVPLDDFNSIYIKSDGSKAYGMWLASPSQHDINNLMVATNAGQVWYNGTELSYCGLRPIVCLKSGVKLQDNGDETLTIVK